LIFGLKRH